MLEHGFARKTVFSEIRKVLYNYITSADKTVTRTLDVCTGIVFFYKTACHK